LLTTAAASSEAMDTALANSLPASGTCCTICSTGDSQPTPDVTKRKKHVHESTAAAGQMAAAAAAPVRSTE
jgi:hypothetical protein